jgi:hypothetical protein
MFIATICWDAVNAEKETRPGKQDTTDQTLNMGHGNMQAGQ